MPELPEVEVVRRGLNDFVVGRRIADVTVMDVRSVRRHELGAANFIDQTTGRTVQAVRRRGKYLWLVLDDGSSILTHLGMSGQALIAKPQVPDPRHLRIRFTLDDGNELRFVDQRIFGGMFVGEGDPPAEISHIAPDPLDVAFDDTDFVQRLRAKRTGVKRAILDQKLVSGVGNIYADEALWRSRLHYARESNTLSKAKGLELIGHLREVMTEALAQGGTSFDALYVNVNGESGYFERSLAAYGREGEPCDRCGTPIVREPFAGRSSHFCPRCQRKR
ncbi:MAG TPA: bifunctional DNA-formamidopyrimidine glycosylase/DNA-(apurinic or apyrimidinic site) lyase [Aeromicrobium sp.]|nr:bifunctional DNA-formamidopyrimidine glycosylase/DNA-(apurinic or apyrimidinic site) lyase [Aeromicrobium sp.]